MANELRRSDRDVLRDCLTRWTDVVSLFERSDPARHRLDTDAYGMSHRVVAWFTPDDCVVLEQ